MSTSLVAVFIPLLFMGGLIGRLFHEFAVTLEPGDSCFRRHFADADADALLAFFEAGIALTGKPGRFIASASGLLTGCWRLLARAEMGVAASDFHAAGRVADLRRHRLALYDRCRKGFFPQQDTGIADGHHRSGAGHFLSRRWPSSRRRSPRIVLADPAVDTLGSFIGGGGGSSTVNNGRMFITLKPLERAKGQRGRGHQPPAQETSQRRRASALFLQAVQDIRVGGRARQRPSINMRCTSATWKNSILVRRARRINSGSIPQLKDVSSDQQTAGFRPMW